ncbi:hypothetical protein IT072_19305 [Leifsonia sp. ZF2019]|uniref:Ig-like domain-containing protein n=1 Tax=Leifsonia sp. ZF2019 TaxID=2781978 RepID=UPI001CBF44AD|nr:Ig-like domain-containing protein [Leifsonia sp. ZF2019]UAJ79313.1 hypothetical protein IT072_19305 [Leifsonia sp. ZF2019]
MKKLHTAGRAFAAVGAVAALAIGGLVAATPASAAGSDMVTGPLAMDYYGASKYFVNADGTNITFVPNANLEAELAAGRIATDWTYPTFGGVGTISRNGKCQVGTAGINRTANYMATCDDTAIAQKWFGNNIDGKLVLTNRTQAPWGKVMWLYDGAVGQQVTTVNEGAKYDMGAGLGLSYAVVDEASLGSPLPGAEITPGTVFSGQAQQGTVVSVKDASGKIIGSATAGADGTWSLVLDPAPKNGTHVLTVAALGTDGKSTELANGSYTMTASDEERALLSPEADTVITPDTVFSGTGHIGDTVIIKDADGTVVGQTTVGNDGKWSTTLDGLVGNGSKNLVVEVTGKDGLTEQLADNTYTVEGVDLDRAVTSPGAGDVITPDTVFTGTGNIGDTVKIKDKDGNTIGSAVVGNDGTWSVPISSLPGNGDTTLTIEVTDKNGTTETLAENTYVVEGVDLDRAVTSPGAGETITPDTVFTGTGNIGDTITIKDKDGNILGQTTVGNDGTWSTTLNPAPTNGDTSLVIEVTGKNGETETIADESYEMEGSTTKFEVTSPNLSESNSIKGDTVFTGKGEPGTTVVLTDHAQNVVGEALVDDHGNWSIPVGSLPQGPNNLTITHTAPGADPVVTDLGPVVKVMDDGEQSTPLMDPAIAGGAALALLAAAGTFLTFRRRKATTAQR